MLAMTDGAEDAGRMLSVTVLSIKVSQRMSGMKNIVVDARESKSPWGDTLLTQLTTGVRRLSLSSIRGEGNDHSVRICRIATG